MKTTVVIPCFNEAERLDLETIRNFVEQNQDIHLLFVDDGSTDSTQKLLIELQASLPSFVRILSLQHNCGKAEAVRQGVLEAESHGSELIGFWDADLATPLEAVPQFRDVMMRRPMVQIVWGARIGLLGRSIDRHAIRRALGRVFSTASAMSVGLPIHDALCGAKMFRSGPLLRSIFKVQFNSRWIFDVELLARMKAMLRYQPETSVNLVFFEQPLDSWREISGSRLRIKDFVRAAIELLNIVVKYQMGRFIPTGTQEYQFRTTIKMPLKTLDALDDAQELSEQRKAA